MPKVKKNEIVEEVESIEPTPVVENPLIARQKFLLDLLDTLAREGFNDKGRIEVELSRVNQALASQ